MSSPQDSGAGGFFKPRVDQKTHKKATHADVMAFFQQLGTLFRAGTPLYEALIIASQQTQSEKLGEVVSAVSQRVSSGETLSDSFDQYPKLFKPEWSQLIRSGEESGQLEQVLDRLIGQISDAADLRSKVVSALTYPALVLLVAVSAISLMLIFVVPSFAKMFAQTGGKIPDITQAVMNLSDFLRGNIGKILLSIVVGIALFRKYVGTEGGRMTVAQILLSLPLAGEIIVQLAMFKFSQNVSALLNAGVPVLGSIDAMKGIYQTNPVYRGAMTRVAQHVGRGGKLAEGIQNTGLFTSFVVNMTRVGEEASTLPDVLCEVGDFYSKKVEVLVGRVTSNLETVAIILMGVAVSVILCALYLPLFSMATGV